METASILKAFITSSSQYASSQTEQNMLHLQRHLDVLMGLTAPPSELTFFDPRQLIVTECIGSLITILLEMFKPSLVQKVISLIQNLVRSPVIRETLRTTFHLHSALATFLQNHGISEDKTLVRQCFQLLEVVTYEVKISYVESHMEHLINLLIKQIENKNSDLLLPSLSILSNICRRNPSIQTHIRAMGTIKQIYKILVAKLSNADRCVIAYSLSVLVSLTVGDEFGEKLFNPKHIAQTFELIINMLVSSDPVAMKIALDLLLEMMTSSRLSVHILRYKFLLTSVQKVMTLWLEKNSSNLEYSSMVLKFILCFTSVAEIRSNLCNSVFINFGTNESEVSEKNVLSLVLQCAEQTVEFANDTPILALQFFKEMVEELIQVQHVHQTDCHFEKFFSIVKEELTRELDFDSYFLRKRLQKQVVLLNILLTICREEELKHKVCQYLDCNNFKLIIEAQLENNPLSLYNDCNWSDDGVNLLFSTLVLMIKIKDIVPDCDKILHTYLQDNRLIPFLAFALGSTLPECVQSSLQIISLGLMLPAFPYNLLGESISATNTSRLQQKLTSLKYEIPHESSPNNYIVTYPSLIRSGSVHCRQRSVDKNVQSLIEKIENGFDIKELKSSEIMDMYEHKITALTVKEKNLQDLVEAKSVALQQADRLLSQYKCRQAQREAEALRLRGLLKESERRSEIAKDQTNQAIHHQQLVQKKLESAQQEINSLEQQNEEQKETISEQAQRLDSGQKALENLQVEYNSISEMNAMLQRHSETMKQKQDLLSQQIADLENEKKNLTKQLKEKDAKLKELNKMLKKTEDSLKKKEEECNELEVTRITLEEKVEKIEKAKSKLEQEVSSLELLCRQHEATIEEKSVQIQALKDQLDQFKNITEVIHNISSGRLNVAALLNKS